MSNTLVRKTRTCQTQIRTFTFINIRKKECPIIFSSSNGRKLKATTTIIINRQPLFPPRLVFLLISIQLLILLYISLSPFFLFSLVFKDACKYILLATQRKRETTLNYMSKGCPHACNSARETPVLIIMLLLFLFLRVLAYARGGVQQSTYRKQNANVQMLIFYSYVVLFWEKEINSKMHCILLTYRSKKEKKREECFKKCKVRLSCLPSDSLLT
jgi:hypothetical protein